MDLNITGKTAFVSGATQGLGRAAANALAQEGANLVIVARDDARLATTADELRNDYGVDVRFVAADFARAGEGTRAARYALDAAGTIDIAVNNAGQTLPGSLETSAEDWAISNQINFLSHIEVIRMLLPAMSAQKWGRIINVVGQAYRHPSDMSTGTIAKYGLLAMSKVLSRQIAHDNVTINAVAVGLFDTPQIERMLDSSDELRAAVAQQIPMARLGRPEELSPGILFFASTAASYVTGSTVTIDGGVDVSML